MTTVSLPIRSDAPDMEVIRQAAAVIALGGVVVYPTETLYGIGVDAGNERALRRVFALKGREGGKPLLVIADSFAMLRPFVAEVNRDAQKLMDAYWPGPLTLVFRATPRASADLTAGTGTLGARVPSSELCRLLARAAGRPITSTSVNRAGQPPLYSADEIRKEFPDGIDLVVDAGTLPPALPSSVVDVTSSPARLLREGAVPWSEIERTLF